MRYIKLGLWLGLLLAAAAATYVIYMSSQAAGILVGLTSIVMLLMSLGPALRTAPRNTIDPKNIALSQARSVAALDATEGRGPLPR